MTEPTRETQTTKVSQDASVSPLIAPLEQGTESNLPAAKTPIDEFLKRNEEVLARDREEFQSYLVAKHEQATHKAREEAAMPKVKTKVSRRTMLNVAVGTAAAAEVAVLGYSAMNGGSSSDNGIIRAAGNGAQQSPITREVVDSRADIRGQSLGNWVALLPTKMGGGTYAIDLNSNRVLGSIWYWNYGDYNPISHHLCAFPSSDPDARLRVREFDPGWAEFVDLRHSHQRDGGERARRHQHLSRTL
jgi:hypothetical protein